MAKADQEKKQVKPSSDLQPEICEHRIKLLQNHVKKIQYLVENEPYEEEHKVLNRMLKIRFDEIDMLKKTKKVNQDIELLEKKLMELRKEKEKLIK